MPRYEIETPINFSTVPSACRGYTPRSGDSRLDWWRAARFGMFLHWGLYAIPAGTWRGRQYKFTGEWIMQQAKIPVAEYEQLAKHFTPQAYDPEAWVQLAIDAGAKYIVFTARHHDGFALFNSSACDWNVVARSPAGEDLVAPLAQACHQRGMKLGFYYSQDIDWHHPHAAGNDWDYPDTQNKDIGRYLRDKVKPQLRELLTNYGPVALLWFDTPVSINAEQSRDLATYVHELQPDCLVSGRIGNHAGDYGSLEDNAIPNGPVVGDWEMPATMNQTWGYKAFDHEWKPASELIRQLADLSGKGVNYLLNLGPDASGSLPQASAERMRTIGEWLALHGEAIYDTQRSPYPYSLPWGSITQRTNKLYLLVEDWPTGVLQLPGLLTPICSAKLIGCNDEPTVTYEQVKVDGIDSPLTQLTLPDTAPNPHVSCVLLELEGEADVDPTPVQAQNGEISIPSQLAELHTSGDTNNAIIGPADLIEQWTSEQTSASWNFGVVEPGEFDVWVVTGSVAAHSDWVGGHRITLELAGNRLQSEITPDRDSRSRRSAYFPERETLLGRVRLSAKGKQQVTMTAEHINPEAPSGICLAEIRLEPVSQLVE